MNKPITIQLTLLGGLAALSLAACSGATPVDSGSTSQNLAQASVAQSSTPAPAAAPEERPHFDPARMFEHLDKDKNGTIELSELPPGMKDHLAKADTNNDGKISLEEWQAKIASHGDKRFARLDTNGDGAITKDEVPAERWAYLSQADANGDGRVTKDEIKQAFESGKLAPPPFHGRGGEGGPGFRRDPAKLLEHLDKDKNGTVELSELPPRLKDRLAKADTNNDGKLTLDELKAQIANREDKHFARLDTNGDGAVTKDEVPAERWAHLSQADANGDGRVTKAELEQAFQSGKLAPPPFHGRGGFGPGFRPDPARMFEHLDKDKNGTVELSELPPRLKERLAKADTNNDGKLTLDELKAHIESHHMPPPDDAPQQ